MKKLLTLFLLAISLTLSAQTKTIASVTPPQRDSDNRLTISFYDYRITETNGYYTVIPETGTNTKPLNGRFRFDDSNSRTVDMELKNNVAVGDWQYYDHTFEGPIISSTVSFVDGYKNGTEYIYSHEWSKETEHFESYVSRIVQYNRGKKIHEVAYWTNGMTIWEQNYDKNGLADGEYIYRSPYTILTKGQYKHGEPVGTWQYFSIDEELNKQVTYKDGLVYTNTYHQNGKPWISKTTRNRIYEGPFLNLTEEGDTVECHFYKNGVEQGYQVIYVTHWQSGVISHYNTNSNGILEGSYNETLRNGDLRVKGQYDSRGLRTGEWYYYVPDGRLYRTETIEDGEVVASTMWWLTSPERPNVYINPDYQHQKFPSGKRPIKQDEPPFFLFSE